jgi:hypothetical protein
MELNFHVNKNRTHFNATLILQQVNTDFAMKKRFNDFVKAHKLQQTVGYVDQVRLEHHNANLEFRPGVQPAKKVRIPSITVIGGGATRRSWLHVSLLPLFLYWLHPEVYARFFVHPRAMTSIASLARVADI